MQILNKKIRILFVIGSLDVGGAERHLLQILPGLNNDKIDAEVYTVFKRGDLAGQLSDCGVKIISPFFIDYILQLWRPFKIPLLVFSSALKFVFTLWRFKPNFVHFFLPHAYIFGGVLSLLYRPTIRLMSRRSLNNYQDKHPFFKSIEHMLHKKMDGFFGNSQAVINNMIEEGMPCARLNLIYNGFDTSQLAILPTKASIRSHLQLSTQSLVFVVVANLIPYKGHSDLLNALSIIKDKLPVDWKLLVVGRDGGILSDLQDLAVRLSIQDNIQWLGQRSDSVRVASCADVGILASHEEGFSNTVIEGMFLGLPMVVTDVGGNSEAVINNVTGLVVPSHDYCALSEAILKLATDVNLRVAMGSMAKDRAHKLFSLDSCVEQYKCFYLKHYENGSFS